MFRIFHRNHKRSSLTLSVAFFLVLSQLLFAGYASAQTGDNGQKIVINQIDGRGWPDITLNITLTGPDGKAVPDIDPSQFEISEENQPQAVTGLTLGAARS